MTIDRRTTLKYGAWSVPAIITATAAPAAAASGGTPPPVPSCIPSDELLITPLEGESFKTNDGQGNTLVKGTGVVITNTTSHTLVFVVGLWTNAGQQALLVIGGNDPMRLESPKDGNKATVVIELLAGQSRALMVSTDKAATKAEAHLVVDCQRFIFKSVGS